MKSTSDRRLVASLLALAKTRDVTVRCAVARKLPELNATFRREGSAVLRQLLTDPNPLVRSEAAEAGALVRDNRITNALINVLRNDSAWVVRASAAEALGSKKTQATRAALLTAIRDRHAVVRSYASSSLGKVGTRQDLRILGVVLAEEVYATTRFALLGAAWRLGDPSAAERLLDQGTRLTTDEETWNYLNVTEDLLATPVPRSLLEHENRLRRVLRSISARDEMVTTQVRRMERKISNVKSSSRSEHTRGEP